MFNITEPQTAAVCRIFLRGPGGQGGVRQSDGCWKAVEGSRKLDGQVHPVSTGYPLCSSQQCRAAGA